jgi:hypothetical protein
MSYTRRQRGGGASTSKYDVMEYSNGIEKYKSPKEEGDFSFDILEWACTKDHPDVILDSKDRTIDDKLKPGDMVHSLTFHVHRNIGPDGQTVICPKRTFGEKCPICEAQVEVAEQHDNNWKHPDVKALFPSERVAHFIIDNDSKDREVKVFEAAPSTFIDELEKAYSMRRKKKGDFEFASLTDGYTVEGYTTLKQIGDKIKYLTYGGFSFEKREEIEIDDLPPMESFLKTFTYDQLKDIFYGNDVEEPEPEPETTEEEPVRRRRRAVERTDDAPECPVSGGTFGKDYDEFNECDDCDLRRNCRKAKRAEASAEPDAGDLPF